MNSRPNTSMDERIRAARYYDELAVREWLRLDSDARARVILALHRRVLERFVSPGRRNVTHSDRSPEARSPRATP